MYIPNDDTQNKPFCILQLVVEMFGHTKLNEPSNLNSIQVRKVLTLTNKRTL